MTQTQTEQALRNPDQVEDTLEPQLDPQKPRGIPKAVRILAAIALLASVGYGVYRLFFYQPEPDGLFLC